MAGTRQVEVNATRPDDTLQYTLHLPVAAPELQPFSSASLPAPTTDSANAAKYTVRVSPRAWRARTRVRTWAPATRW